MTDRHSRRQTERDREERETHTVAGRYRQADRERHREEKGERV